MRRLQHRGMIRESEIIVGAQIDHFAPVGELHDRLPAAEPMMRSRFSKPGGVERLGVALEPFTKFL